MRSLTPEAKGTLLAGFVCAVLILLGMIGIYYLPMPEIRKAYFLWSGAFLLIVPLVVTLWRLYQLNAKLPDYGKESKRIYYQAALDLGMPTDSERREIEDAAKSVMAVALGMDPKTVTWAAIGDHPERMEALKTISRSVGAVIFGQAVVARSIAIHCFDAEVEEDNPEMR